MKVITITGEWLNTLPLPHTRPYMIGHVFDLAKERHWTVRVKGLHWDT